jgi:hypothetical protein
MNARVYDPDIGRFLSPDPTVPYTHNPQSFNRYSYVMNNPLNRYDPTGFADESTQGQDNDKSPTQTKSDAKTETTDNLGQGKATTSTDPKGAKNTSGLGFKGGVAGLFPADAPIHQIGKALGTVAAHLEGLVTNNKTLTEITMQGLQDDRPQNMQLAGMLMSMGRMPAKGQMTPTQQALGGKNTSSLSNDALVVRGGTSKAEQFAANGKVGADGKLTDSSVNSAVNKTAAELSVGIPNKQMGVTTVGNIRAQGGDVKAAPNPNNPDHCSMCGLTPKQAEQLFNPTIRNPNIR